jgi:exodeoxyribonuclease VII large subunit
MMSDTKTTERKVVSVSALNAMAKDLLESNLPALWIEGEISNFASPSSGHWYFTLKDARSQVRCAMFRGRNTGVRFKPIDGQKVTLLANVSLYAERGEYQLIIDHIEQSGEGLLRLAFEKLKAQLKQEGLFDEQYKKPLPTWVQHVGVITSPTGAAIHDILTVFKRRFPSIHISVIPVPVQGKDAGEKIAKAISFANEKTDCDVLIVGRGGGSLEDLWSFNEEVVARAIFASHLPIVSAVGHEVDFSIADFVADVRAATPSAAAELISQDQYEINNIVAGYTQRLISRLRNTIDRNRNALTSLNKRLRHPGQILQAQTQTLDHLELRLQKATTHQLHVLQTKISELHGRLQQHTPTHELSRTQLLVDHLRQRLTQQITITLANYQQRMAAIGQQLHIVSPLATLERGYSIVTDVKKRVIRNAANVKKGDVVYAKVAEGDLTCVVTDHKNK